MNWSVIFEPDTLALYGQGLVVTLQLTLYSLGLGLGLPLLLIGVAGDKLLPHAGACMNTVRRAYGVALLGMALYFARTLLPPMVLMLAWSALFIG